jgi:hypothetical protein
MGPARPDTGRPGPDGPGRPVRSIACVRKPTLPALEQVRVHQVLGPPARPLVLDEVPPPDDVDVRVSVARLHPLRPGLLEGHAVDRGEHVDAVRLHADLEAACTASAYPSTRRYSARSAFNAANRSLKSGFTGIGGPPGEVLENQLPRELEATGRRHVSPECPVELPVVLVEANDASLREGAWVFDAHDVIMPRAVTSSRFPPPAP